MQSNIEAKQTIANIDAVRRSTYFRDPDRPDARFVKPRRKRTPTETTRAMQRLRTDAWRAEMDRRRAPSASQIGMALVIALVKSKPSEWTEADRGVLAKALLDLDARGFDVKEAKATLQRMKKRLSDDGSVGPTPIAGDVSTDSMSI